MDSAAAILSELRDQGFGVERIDNRYKVAPPDKTKPLVFFNADAASTRDSRTLKNILSELRRSGFVWPPPEKTKPEPPRLLTSSRVALEELFTELKDSRDYLILASEALEKAEADLQAAIAKRDACAADVAKGRVELDAAKKRFDKMCGVE